MVVVRWKVVTIVWWRDGEIVLHSWQRTKTDREIYNDGWQCDDCCFDWKIRSFSVYRYICSNIHALSGVTSGQCVVVSARLCRHTGPGQLVDASSWRPDDRLLSRRRWYAVQRGMSRWTLDGTHWLLFQHQLATRFTELFRRLVRRAAKYCDARFCMHVCVSVGLCVHSHIWKTAWLKYTNTCWL